MKTVRFTELVKACGRPEQVTLWTAPEDNRDFMKAVRENRVVTLFLQNVGTKADYGVVGFVKQPLTSFLVFPKPLPYPEETKIIGIKYDQIAESEPKGPLPKPKAERPPGVRMREKSTTPIVKESQKPKETKKEEPPPPKPPRVYQFHTHVDIAATQRIPIIVEASSEKEARRLVKEQADAAQMKLEDARIVKKIGKVVKGTARP